MATVDVKKRIAEISSQKAPAPLISSSAVRHEDMKAAGSLDAAASLGA
jgi:hypothetical protein